MNIDAASPDLSRAQGVVSVGELVRQVAATLERSFALQWVAGEVSNLTRASSGHWYFSLKDRDAQVRCVMFRSRNQAIDWPLRDGERVEARVLPGLYAPRGEFQLQVEQMRRAGAGALFEAFLRIKAALEALGLFEPARKRPLPLHPRQIGIVTSLQAAALRDVLTTLARRAPHIDVLVFPTLVQGADAPPQIVAAIAAAGRHPIDVLLVVRGGGSIEDLWAFNDERVAHAIAASTVPVVSGIGHETDFTIADFVADVRAPTPTAAAELASPDGGALVARVTQRRDALVRVVERRLNTWSQRIDEAARRLRSPEQRLVAARARLDEAIRRLTTSQATRVDLRTRGLSHAMARLRAASPSTTSFGIRLASARERLVRAVDRRVRTAVQVAASTQARLLLLDPKGILERGYAIATDEAGRIVRDAADVRAGQRVTVEVGRGRFATEVVDQPPA
jgi:exodeoxyribonuclease VII large subunit